MMDWNVLGIEPTDDREAIEKAYNDKLNGVDLENRPEEFEKLHKAYQEALSLLSLESAQEDEFRSLFRINYKDFGCRIDPEAWKTLIDKGEAQLGKEKSEAVLFDMLMDMHVLPQEVWKYLDTRYTILQRKKELLDKYPPRFVREVLVRGVRFREVIPFKLFYPGRDGDECDRYLMDYMQVMAGDPESASKAEEDMLSLKEQHPYGTSLAARKAVMSGNTDRIAEIEKVCSDNPGNTDLMNDLAACYFMCGSLDKCEEACRTALITDEDDVSIKLILAQCLAKNARFMEAADLLTEIIKDPSTDNVLRNRLSSLRADWNRHVMNEYTDSERDGNADPSSVLDHAWRCLQNNSVEEAKALAAKIDIGSVGAVAYHDLMNQVAFVTGNAEEAIDHASELVKLAEVSSDEKGRLSEYLVRKANALYMNKQTNEALDTYRYTLERCGDDTNIMSMLYHLLLFERKNDEALQCAEKMAALEPDSFRGHHLLADALFVSGDTERASEEIDEALELENSDIDPFILKMRILIKKKAYDDAEQLLSMLKRAGGADITGVKWCEGLIQELKYLDNDKALDQYFDVAERIESGEFLTYGSNVYYRIALCMRAQMAEEEDQNEIESRLRDLIRKGLELNPEDPDCISFLDTLDSAGGDGLKSVD